MILSFSIDLSSILCLWYYLWKGILQELMQMYCFSLAITFIDIQPCLDFPLRHRFRIEQLSSRYTVFQTRELVAWEE